MISTESRKISGVRQPIEAPTRAIKNRIGEKRINENHRIDEVTKDGRA